VDQRVNKFPLFYQPGGSLPSSKNPATDSIISQMNPIQNLTTFILKKEINIMFPSLSRPRKRFHLSVIPTSILSVFLISPALCKMISLYSLNNHITYLLTELSLLEELPIVQLLKNFPAF
jgi:hypothetical protein